MSKLAENIHTAITNYRVVSPNVNMTMEIESPSDPKSVYAYKVRFQAVFGKSVYIDESALDEKFSVLEDRLQNIKKGVVQEIFGEFRDPIMSIRYSLFDRDIDKALDLLKELEKQMFDV